MRKIILSEYLSADGYVADRKGQLDFFGPQVRKIGAEADQVRFIETIDTLLMGRKTYEQFAQVWPDRPASKEVLADTINKARKIVFSNTLKKAPWGKWPEAEIESGELVPAIGRLKSLPGGNIVVWASISLAQHLMKANLIDEYQLFVCPVLTAGGRRLFTEEMDPTSLRLLKISRYETGIVCLHYQKS